MGTEYSLVVRIGAVGLPPEKLAYVDLGKLGGVMGAPEDWKEFEAKWPANAHSPCSDDDYSRAQVSMFLMGKLIRFFQAYANHPMVLMTHQDFIDLYLETWGEDGRDHTEEFEPD